MSKDILSSITFSRDKSISGISQAISAAFGNHVLPPKRSSSDLKPKTKYTSLKTKQIGKETFLTEAEMNEIEEQMNNDLKTAMTYEEMIKEVDTIRSGIKNRDDDLTQLKLRLQRCKAAIDVQEANFYGLDKSAKEIHSQGKTMMKKFRSMATLPKHDLNKQN